jgi:hypothetical protein
MREERTRESGRLSSTGTPYKTLTSDDQDEVHLFK